MTSTVITSPVVESLAAWDENTVPAAPVVTTPQPVVTETPSVSAPSSTLTWVQAAVRVLSTKDEDMSVSDILDEIKAAGLRNVAGCKTPLQTLRRDLRVEARKENPRVVATAKGRYAAKK